MDNDPSATAQRPKRLFKNHDARLGVLLVQHVRQEGGVIFVTSQLVLVVVARLELDAIVQSSLGDVLVGDIEHVGQVEDRAGHLRVVAGEED